ncbi:MAG: adenylate/guanylate cyclase domain-containing protein [Acidimicrobiales bacterium]
MTSGHPSDAAHPYAAGAAGAGSSLRESESPDTEPAPPEEALVRSLAARHAPEQREFLEEVVSAAINHKSLTCVVISCDIGKSTFLMKEAVSPARYASTLDQYVSAAKHVVRNHAGWFDKFTGDGFLAYWPYGQGDLIPTIEMVIKAMLVAIDFFNDKFIPLFRANSQNFPDGVGISMGLDAGTCFPAVVADDLTIIGAPVVGAVRMGSVALASEFISNVYAGEFLYTHQGSLFPAGISIGQEYRDTKEYRQQVFPITWDRDILDVHDSKEI